MKIDFKSKVGVLFMFLKSIFGVGIGYMLVIMGDYSCFFNYILMSYLDVWSILESVL